jgi:xanthine dehydrogenase YagT iron-sulfur-binding subunit
MAVVLHVNGTEHRLLLDPRTTLLDALREHLQLTAAAFVAGHALVIDGGQTV